MQFKNIPEITSYISLFKVLVRILTKMATNLAFTGEGERMAKPSGSGFGTSASYSELSMLERSESRNSLGQKKASRPKTTRINR